MEEHPIIFQPENVRAILRVPPEIPKTETRRLKAPWEVGDRLWVRETFVLEDTEEYHESSLAPTDRPFLNFGYYFLIPHYRATEPEPMICEDGEGTKWKSSIFMPRWASRITLEVTAKRQERLQEITDYDCVCEGVLYCEDDASDIRDNFAKLWDSINGKKPSCSWADNPLVWVTKFKRIEPK